MSASPPVFSKTLRRDIVILLWLKVAALMLAYWMFFGPGTRAASDAHATAARILSPSGEGHTDGS